MIIDDINALSATELKVKLALCCASQRWVDLLVERRPFSSIEQLLATADEVWTGLSPDDWQEALRHHPRIGPLSESEHSKKDWQDTKQFVLEEHKGVDAASQNSLTALVKLNREYEEKFGYIFLISAKGKSYKELVAALAERVNNSPEVEIQNVRIEEGKIIQNRLRQLCEVETNTTGPRP